MDDTRGMCVYWMTDWISMHNGRQTGYVRVLDDRLDQYAQWTTDGVCAYTG
jgi:hypothetical protein